MKPLSCHTLKDIWPYMTSKMCYLYIIHIILHLRIDDQTSLIIFSPTQKNIDYVTFN